MKVLDLETKTYHNVVSIDYDTNTIVMESPEYGRTRNTLDKVRLIHDTSEDMKGKTIISRSNGGTIVCEEPQLEIVGIVEGKLR